ncbi:PAS domain S-box protein [Hymenobacter yonginensis]|uniref:histidine kinase n=1 Tax=Hymenobacter yonginensis TaxID=748197 RepID=A0ABY7PNI6_9BACT|nr:PAS domain S-box protein [Hymenobacter yonginensis]WBO83738.1 PAS domain S-box protein [Hymenobacter yonginensis]
MTSGSLSLRQLQRRLRFTQNALQAQQQEMQQLREELAQQNAAAANQVAALLQTMHTGLLVADRNRRITLLNQNYCDLLGLPQPATHYLGASMEELWIVSGQQVRNAEVLITDTVAAMRGQERSTLLMELLNGRILQQEYLPVVAQGVTQLYLLSYEDVTQQQQVLARVRELSRLAEQSPSPIICFGLDGEALYANSAANHVLQALSQPQWQSDRTFLQQQITEALQEGASRVIERPLDERFYHWTIVPLPAEQAANVYLTDITARRQAESELRHSQRFAARINDTIPAIVYLFDVQQRRMVYLNRQMEHVLGYTEEDLKSFGLEILQHLFDRQSLEAATSKQGFLAGMTDQQLSTGEYRVRHRDGSWRWIWVRSRVFLRDAQGRVQQILGSAEDITERKITEQALRQSQLLMERVAYTAPNLIYIYDLQNKRNLYCNRSIEHILGYTGAEIQALGSNVLPHLMPPSQVKLLEDHYAQVAQLADGQMLTLEYFLNHRNGSVRWMRVTDTPFERDENGRVLQLVGVGEDITRWKVADEQRRTANRRLAEQNRLFRQVIDTAPHLIYLKDRLGNYLLANKAIADLYGMTPQQIVGAQPETLPNAPGEGQRYRRQDEELLRTGKEMVLEESFIKPDGEILWFYSIKRPFLLADGSMQILGIDTNITELKRTQLDLHAAKEAAEQNAQAKQDFLANMSHEIRTPLNGILGIAGLLAKTPLDDQQNQFLRHIRYSADHLLVVINDVLAMAELGAGKIRPENIAFDVRDVLTASRELLLPRAQEKGIALELDLPPAAVPTTVLGDPHRLRQVLLNLISNAVKFTAHGRVLVSCQPLSLSAEQATLQFRVVDTGTGIAAHQLQQMFEPFMQASSSTAREYGGSGLGLSISRGLVELMGGTLTAESRLHEGSTFSFTLSFRYAAQVADAAVSRPAPAPNYRRLGARRVLLAEDNAINQFLVEALLGGWGWTLDTAGTGPDALTLFNQHRYDVVLMDIQMPGMDGVEATRQLRQHPDPERAATPVLALTAHALRGEAERFRQAGFSGYLSKPFQEEQLFQAIAGALGQRPAVLVATPDAPESEPTAALYSLSGIRRLAHGNEEFVRRLAQLFIQTTPPAVRELEQHLAAADFELLGAAAHQLKSSLDGLQIRSLHGPIRRLEAGRKEPLDLQEAKQLVDLVCKVTEQVMDGLRLDFPGL